MDWRTVHTPATRRHQAAPQQTLITTYWSLVGPTGRPFTCAAYHVETGIELRAG